MSSPMYDSYEIRCGGQKLETTLEAGLMDILMEFGASVDCHGFDDGDYDTAMKALIQIFTTKEEKL